MWGKCRLGVIYLGCFFFKHLDRVMTTCPYTLVLSFFVKGVANTDVAFLSFADERLPRRGERRKRGSFNCGKQPCSPLLLLTTCTPFSLTPDFCGELMGDEFNDSVDQRPL